MWIQEAVSICQFVYLMLIIGDCKRQYDLTLIKKLYGTFINIHLMSKIVIYRIFPLCLQHFKCNLYHHFICVLSLYIKYFLSSWLSTVTMETVRLFSSYKGDQMWSSHTCLIQITEQHMHLMKKSGLFVFVFVCHAV